MASMKSNESGEHVYDQIKTPETRDSYLRMASLHFLTPVHMPSAGSRSASASAAINPMYSSSSNAVIPPRTFSRTPLPSRSSSVRSEGHEAATTPEFHSEGGKEDILVERSLDETEKYTEVERNRNGSSKAASSGSQEYADLQLQDLSPSSQYASPLTSSVNLDQFADGTPADATNTTDGELDKVSNEVVRNHKVKKKVGIIRKAGLEKKDFITSSIALVALAVAIAAIVITVVSNVRLSNGCSQCFQNQLDEHLNESQQQSQPFASNNCTLTAIAWCHTVSRDPQTNRSLCWTTPKPIEIDGFYTKNFFCGIDADVSNNSLMITTTLFDDKREQVSCLCIMGREYAELSIPCSLFVTRCPYIYK